MSCQGCGCDTQPCGCCVGVQQLTPANECNRPGLPSISYRVGTHGQFLSTMKARLSTMMVDGVGPDGQTVGNFWPLQGLTARDAGDFSIALLDGWATVGDVLSFYQERVANEGYLRTATERRSVLELANLVGYTLRPGVAATVYLAYTIDTNQIDPALIPAGARSQSIPGPGETPQSFETSDPLEARAGWNALKPRVSRPQLKETITSADPQRIYVQGITTNLKTNDALLIDFGDGETPTPYRVLAVTPEPALKRSLVTFSNWDGSTAAAPAAGRAVGSAPPGAPARGGAGARVGAQIDPAIGLMEKLILPPSVPPRSTLTLPRDLKSTFTVKADIGSQLVSTFQPILQGTFSAALANERATSSNKIRLFVLRARAAPFGNVAPLKVTTVGTRAARSVELSEWNADDMGQGTQTSMGADEQPNIINFDASYDKIVPGSWLIIDTSAVNWGAQSRIRLPDGATNPMVVQADSVAAGVARAAYGMSGKTTQISLTDASQTSVDWFEFIASNPPVIGAVSSAADFTDLSFQLIRRTTVFAQGEELALVDESITDDICHGASSWIELDGYYSDLKSGRWVIVSGERADITIPDPDNSSQSAGVPGVQGSELLMLSNVVQDVALANGTPQSHYQSQNDMPAPAVLPNETLHTFIQFAKDLQYCYSRDKVSIYGNVVKATHGETRNETLGNGDGSKTLQSFTLKQPPLTFVAAPTAAGADSTLRAYVNNVEWHEQDSLAFFGPKDRIFVTNTDDAGNTTLTFGDGVHGSRLPTGQLNVTSVYRNGIGSVGNVRAGQVSLLQTRPLGAKSVVNPLPASGGADKEARDLARENAPLSVMPLDRLVSVQDYADFTRRFAGIGKAAAQRTSDGRKQLVYLTIAGVDDIPIDATSDLYRNLLDALQLQGDPDLPVRVDARELKMLVMSAKIKILPDYLWEPVVTAVRARLLDAFGFGKRGLGQWALLSEVMSQIQGVAGVDYIDIDAFGGVPEKVPDTAQDGTAIRRALTPAEVIAAVQFIVDPDAVLQILRSPSAKDRLPKNVEAFAGGVSGGLLRPAELVIFTPDVPDTLILNQIL
jgi:hypothetical protein